MFNKRHPFELFVLFQLAVNLFGLKLSPLWRAAAETLQSWLLDVCFTVVYFTGVPNIWAADMQPWGSLPLLFSPASPLIFQLLGSLGLCSDSSTSTFAVRSLNFKYPLDPTHKENRKLTWCFSLLSAIFSPPVSACFCFLCNAFRCFFSNILSIVCNCYVRKLIDAIYSSITRSIGLSENS